MSQNAKPRRKSRATRERISLSMRERYRRLREGSDLKRQLDEVGVVILPPADRQNGGGR